MNILIIHNRYSKIGGEEKVVEMQQKLLSAAGHNVYSYIRDYAEKESWRLGKIQSLFSALYSRHSIRDIKKIVKEFHPNVAIVHNLFPIISAAIIPELKRLGIPVVMTIHNYRLLCPIGLFFQNGKVCTKCAESKLREVNCALQRCEGSTSGSIAFSIRGLWSRMKGYFDNVDIFLSVSEFQKRNLIKFGIDENKIRVLPNCIEVRSTSNAKEDYIAFIGRLSSEKGIDLLFDIASRLPEIRFRVAGDKSPKFNITNIPENVELLGFLRGEELENFISHAKALIFTSRVWEAMPLAPLEAMASGTVVIANRVSSIPEILDNGKAGLIFDNAEDGAKKVKFLLENPKTRIELETAGLKRVQEHYSTKLYTGRLLQVCKNIK